MWFIVDRKGSIWYERVLMGWLLKDLCCRRMRREMICWKMVVVFGGGWDCVVWVE